MQHPSSDTHSVAAKVPWNKGKMIGAKPPLQTRHVWSIRTKLQMDGKKRDLALFNLAIDSKLRGCDVDRIGEQQARSETSYHFGSMIRPRRSGAFSVDPRRVAASLETKEAFPSLPRLFTSSEISAASASAGAGWITFTCGTVRRRDVAAPPVERSVRPARAVWPTEEEVPAV
jgi:hypothetical protein